MTNIVGVVERILLSLFEFGRVPHTTLSQCVKRLENPATLLGHWNDRIAIARVLSTQAKD